MDNHGFYECNSSDEVLRVLLYMPANEREEVEKQYSLSGCELAVQIMKTKGLDEPKDLSSEFLSSSVIDNALIRLKQKEIAEQIRSNKVIEGILKDIALSSNRVADGMEWANNFINKQAKG